MQYKVIDDFLDKIECQKLIQDAENFSNEIRSIIHGNRQIMPSTSIKFLNLENKSILWNELSKRLNCQNFFDFCVKELNLKYKNKFQYKNFFKKKKYSNFEISYKKLCEQNANTLPTLSLFKIFCFRLYKRVLRYFFCANDFFSKKNNIELLYDYSKSGNGYGREIHRDSDSRYIVILLYLNDLDDGAKGGSLDIFKLKNGSSKTKDAQPKNTDCELVESIMPKAGRLVIFLNNEISYHAVSEMKNSKNYRHFLYGGFTLLSKKNPLIQSSTIMNTNFDLYL